MEQNQCTDQEIIKALEFWMQSLPDPEERSFEYDGAHYSPNEIIDHIKGGTSLGAELLETVRSLSQKMGMDPRQVILISFGGDAQN
jgi:hypothetical protein